MPGLVPAHSAITIVKYLANLNQKQLMEWIASSTDFTSVENKVSSNTLSRHQTVFIQE